MGRFEVARLKVVVRFFNIDKVASFYKETPKIFVLSAENTIDFNGSLDSMTLTALNQNVPM